MATTVPAKVSAVADRLTRATLLVALVGSVTTCESSAPAKPVSVYVTVGESKVMVLKGGGL